jgi:predicted amidophosphoribosyltransferase
MSTCHLYIICSHCGAAVEAGADMCENCGRWFVVGHKPRGDQSWS